MQDDVTPAQRLLQERINELVEDDIVCSDHCEQCLDRVRYGRQLAIRYAQHYESGELGDAVLRIMAVYEKKDGDNRNAITVAIVLKDGVMHVTTKSPISDDIATILSSYTTLSESDFNEMILPKCVDEYTLQPDRCSVEYVFENEGVV